MPSTKCSFAPTFTRSKSLSLYQRIKCAARLIKLDCWLDKQYGHDEILLSLSGIELKMYRGRGAEVLSDSLNVSQYYID